MANLLLPSLFLDAAGPTPLVPTISNAPVAPFR